MIIRCVRATARINSNSIKEIINIYSSKKLNFVNGTGGPRPSDHEERLSWINDLPDSRWSNSERTVKIETNKIRSFVGRL